MEDKLDPEKDLKNITTSLLCVIENVPPSETTMNLYLEFHNGKLSNIIVKIGDSFTEKEAIFVITGNYGTYKDIMEGKLGLAMAIL
jgi:putative sterol carrier protein